MDAVIMCCDLDSDPPNIQESDKVMFCAKLHNYIIAISKLDSVWLPSRLFSVVWSLGPRADRRRDLFSMQTPCEFFATDIHFF